MSIEHETTLIFSSDVKAGAVEVSDDGSAFTGVLEEPLEIPKDAYTCSVAVASATIWWDVPNVFSSGAEANNEFHLEYKGTPYVAAIPQGLYSLSNLESAIEFEFVNQGLPSGLFNLIGDNSTQRVFVRINVADVQIEFVAGTIMDLIGFNAQLVPAGGPTTAAFIQLGDTQAKLNTVDYFVIHSDIVQRGVYQNGAYTNAIDSVLIDVPPGSQIVYRPVVQTRVAARGLIGSRKMRFKFWLTDQSNNPVNTNGEAWSVKITVRYVHVLDVQTEKRLKH
jgi:hypothetical protein